MQLLQTESEYLKTFQFVPAEIHSTWKCRGCLSLSSALYLREMHMPSECSKIAAATEQLYHLRDLFPCIEVSDLSLIWTVMQ